MRLKEIEERLKQIEVEMRAEGADLEALNKEVDTLIAERKALIDAAEQRQKILNNISSGVIGTQTPVVKDEERSEFTYESAEFRSGYLKQLRKMDLTDIEKRAVAAVGAVIPKMTLNKIVSVIEESPLLASIDITYIPGTIVIPVESSVSEAEWKAMGTPSTSSADAITELTLSAYKLIKTVEITADVERMSIDAFEDWITRRLGEKIRKALAAAAVSGSGTNQPQGITTLLGTASGTFTKTGLTYKELCKIIGTLPADYIENARFTMSSTLFFSDFVGMTDTSGKPAIVVDPQGPVKYSILGFPIQLDASSPADGFIFGDMKMYKMNIGSGPEIAKSTEAGFLNGSAVYRGMALADGKPALKAAFLWYNRAS